MSNPSILIVEDEAEDLASKVRKLGYEVVGTTSSGEEAFELARQLLPALVLMDIRLDGAMDGIEAAEKIHLEYNLPILFLTAHSDRGTVERARQAGTFGYILKPFDERDLRVQIEMALYKHAVDQQLRVSKERLAGINQILQAALTCETEEELGRTCLAIAEKITRSQFGFIGEINKAGLEDIAISNPGWDAWTIIDPGGHLRPPGNFKMHGLYGRVISDGRGLFTNDPANHPDSIGLPENHPPLTSFLGVPLIREGKVIGMLAVGNREGGYTQAEQDTLEALAPPIVEAFTRKRVEEALRRAKEAWERTFDSVPDLITILDNQHQIMRVNAAMATRLGLKPEECIGLPCYETVHGTSCPPAYCPHSRTIADGREHVEEVHEERLGGDFLVTTAPILDKKGERIGSVHIARDITERKQSEAKLQALNEELEMRVKERTLELQETQKLYLHAEKLSAIGKLSASIAHEFNNPLQGILTVLKGLKKRAILEEEDKKLLNAAIGEGDRIKELIRSLHDFNRPSSGRKTFMDVHQSLDAILLLQKSDLNERRITVERDYAESLPQIMVISDQVKQVFLNLLANAADACSHHGGLITVSTWQENDNVAVAIKDSGIGIKPEDMEHIFRPFFTTKAEFKGTGLGLPVSYGIVNNHQGKIQVESQPGEGTTFTVVLPIKGAGEIISATGVTP